MRNRQLGKFWTFLLGNTEADVKDVMWPRTVSPCFPVITLYFVMFWSLWAVGANFVRHDSMYRDKVFSKKL